MYLCPFKFSNGPVSVYVEKPNKDKYLEIHNSIIQSVVS